MPFTLSGLSPTCTTVLITTAVSKSISSGLVRDDGHDDGAGEHVALGKAELQGRVNGKAVGL